MIIKNKILILSALAAGAAFIGVLIKRRTGALKMSAPVPKKNSHHRTDVFSRAKVHTE